MPESCTDRPTSATEKVFLLTKAARYFYDAEAVKEASESDESSGGRQRAAAKNDERYIGADFKDYHDGRTGRHQTYQPLTRNMRNWWLLGPAPYPEAHFATFSPEIPKRAILAGTSERGVCARCGAPWERVVERSGGTTGKGWTDHSADMTEGAKAGTAARAGWENDYAVATLGWRATCRCAAAAPIAATVLDPFLGAGTTALVADRERRNCIGIELSPDYAAMARRRLEADAPLFLDMAAE
jgi:hypothetical protein